MKLDNLSTFFLTNNNINKWSKYISLVRQDQKYNNIKKQKETKKEEIKEHNDYKTIYKKDPLFWAYYFIMNGEFSYMTVHNDFFTEKNNKIELVKKIRENKDLFKKHKIKKNIVEDQVLNSIEIDCFTFCCICLMENINFILQEDHFYWTHIINDENIHIIKKINKNISVYVGENTESEAENIKKTCIQASFNKKIKSFSNYKLPDILELAEKLKINIHKENGKKKTKKDIYSEIQKFI
tara:strand:- start:72 stop:788 length:717 start_codon:yes stop_codon:yes gene_type:complete